MSVTHETSQRIRKSRTENPRTILAFFATVIGLTLTAIVAAVSVLANANVETGLIPWLLGFAALLVISVLGIIFAIAIRDPSKLMLGQVTGTEYVEIQKLSVIGTVGAPSLSSHAIQAAASTIAASAE